jgi:hypothetical protein
MVLLPRTIQETFATLPGGIHPGTVKTPSRKGPVWTLFMQIRQDIIDAALF